MISISYTNILCDRGETTVQTIPESFFHKQHYVTIEKTNKNRKNEYHSQGCY